MQKNYIIRLDDACPTMNSYRWQRVEYILDQYHIKPIVGIIPNCKDDTLFIDDADPSFWEKTKRWQAKGWTIALHGFDHCYLSDKGLGGINPMWRRSEFSGVSLDEQKNKIRMGQSILKSKGLRPICFFAPSHTFDTNTLTALKEESDIRIICDTIATKPYKFGDFVFVPQVGGHCVDMLLPGTWTFCLHPNLMEENDFVQTEIFLKKRHNSFISIDEISMKELNKKDVLSKLLSSCYFALRRLKGIV